MCVDQTLTGTVWLLVLTSGDVLQLPDLCLQLILIFLHLLLDLLEESLCDSLHLLRTDTWFSCGHCGRVQARISIFCLRMLNSGFIFIHSTCVDMHVYMSK